MKYLETLIPYYWFCINTNPNACFVVPLKKTDFLKKNWGGMQGEIKNRIYGQYIHLLSSNSYILLAMMCLGCCIVGNFMENVSPLKHFSVSLISLMLSGSVNLPWPEGQCRNTNLMTSPEINNILHQVVRLFLLEVSGSKRKFIIT